MGGSLPRLLQAAILGPAIEALSSRRIRVGGLEANKDLAYINQIFEAGLLVPVIDSQYPLAEAADAFRRFAAAD